MTAPGSVRRVGGGRVEIRFERRFAHPQALVWRAITDPAELRGWRFPAVVELDLRPGATVWFHPTPEQRERLGVAPEPVAGRVIAADPPRLLEYTWGAETLRWELTPDGDGCRLVFVNTIDDDGAGPAVAGGWHAGLELLEAALAGRAIDTDDAWQRAADLQGQYEEKAMTETLHTDGDHTVLRMERRFRHPRSRVWSAITEAGHLAQWFPARVELEPVAGSEVSYDMGDGPSVDGRVTEADPGRVLAFTWGDELLRFELHDDGDGCRLSFQHTFTDRYGAASFASGWAQCFVGLDQVLDGVPVTAGSPSAEQHDAYVEQFGLGAGIVSAGDDGGRLVRFERQLTAPAETAWTVVERLAAVPAELVRERDEPKLLTYTTADGARVRWELGEGTGHGARLVLTVSGGAAADDTAWSGRVADLARDLRDRSASPS